MFSNNTQYIHPYSYEYVHVYNLLLNTYNTWILTIGWNSHAHTHDDMRVRPLSINSGHRQQTRNQKRKDNYQSVTQYKANTTLNSCNLFFPRYPIRLIQMRTHGSVGRTIQAKSLTHGIAQALLIGQRPIPPILHAIRTCISTYVNPIRIGSKRTEDR